MKSFFFNHALPKTEELKRAVSKK